MAAAAVAAGGRYAGTKIVAIGKNYAKHVVEMGGALPRAAPGTRATPVFFIKPNSTVIHEGEPIVLPRGVGEIHHEVELGVVVGRRARHVRASSWRDCVRGYVLALDMTARDLQAKAKVAGLPWSHGKCYDTFTPLSLEIPAARVPDPHALTLSLTVGGAQRQHGSTGDMITRIPEIIEFVSGIMTLEPGDVILTGTPDGVGPVRGGDRVKASLEGLLSMQFDVVDAPEDPTRLA